MGPVGDFLDFAMYLPKNCLIFGKVEKCQSISHVFGNVAMQNLPDHALYAIYRLHGW